MGNLTPLHDAKGIYRYSPERPDVDFLGAKPVRCSARRLTILRRDSVAAQVLRLIRNGRVLACVMPVPIRLRVRRRIEDVARAVTHIPEELTRERLTRLGEGIGKVVYASEHWVVKRQRSPTEVVALIILWKFLRRWTHALPLGWGDYLLKRPSRILRLMRIMMQAVMAVLPRSLWFTTHIAQVLRGYRYRELRGEKLARAHLTFTDLVPELITFPPAIVSVGGWPGWLSVQEATERVEDTLDKRLEALAAAGDFDTVQLWLSRFLDTRQAGWSHGLFSVDAHLKNFGIIGDRIVLLDSGGLTDRWSDIAARLSKEEDVPYPHVQLGLEGVLSARPELAQEFNERWKSVVNRQNVQELWPEN